MQLLDETLTIFVVENNKHGKCFEWLFYYLNNC